MKYQYLGTELAIKQKPMKTPTAAFPLRFSIGQTHSKEKLTRWTYGAVHSGI